MAVVQSASPSLVLDDRDFCALVDEIAARFNAIGPRIRDFSIVLDTIEGADDLAAGVTLDQEPGRCTVTPLPDGDSRRFAWAVGPDSAKATRHPSEKLLFTATVDGNGVQPQPSPELSSDKPLAIIGLRPCDAAAAATLHRVLDDGEGATGSFGPDRPFVVVVNCTDPGGTCFCASMGTGPALPSGSADDVDIVLWERSASEGQRTPEYLVTHTSERGVQLLEDLGAETVGESDEQWTSEALRSSVERMGRRLDTEQLAERLTMTLGSERWNDVAQRCLSCGNCTMVCPTCFCTSVHDSSDLDGSTVERTQRWDSCFTLDHSFIHGGSVRAGTHDRYRQWLTHKLSSWWGQFGESGCVGCGRCISWCPVGIDLVEEANLLSAEAASSDEQYDEAVGVTSVLLRRRDRDAR